MSSPTPMNTGNKEPGPLPQTVTASPIPDAWPVAGPKDDTPSKQPHAPKKRRRKTKRLVFLIPAILLMLALAAWQLIPRLLPSGTQTPVTQRLSEVTRGNLTVTITGSGPLEPAGKRTVTAETDTTITEILHKNGDSVHPGDLLMRLDPSDAASALREATSTLEEAIDAAQDTSSELSSLVVQAPFSGRVTTLSVEPDDKVSANGTMLELTDTTRLKATIPFGASDKSTLQVGQNVRLSLPETEGHVMGTVADVAEDSHAITGGGQAVDVDILIPNPGSLVAGQTATVEIETPSGWLSGLSQATLTYAQSTAIRSEPGGTVLSVAVRENQLVNRGAVLLTMENDSLETSAESQQKRILTLTDKVTAAQEIVDSCEVRATADGILTGLNASVGDAVKAGSALCAILDVSHMTMEIAIDELDITNVAEGQTISVVVDAVGETAEAPVSGSVTGIAVEGSYTNGVTTFPVTLSLDPDERLRSGMNADASILVTDKQDVLLVPIEAVNTAGGRSFVYVVGGTDATAPASFAGDASARPEAGDTSTRPDDGDAPPRPSAGVTPTRPSADDAASRPDAGARQNAAGRQGSTDATGYYAGATRVFIETGAHNETYMEVLGGLSEGDQVVLPALTASSDTQAAEAVQGGGFGGMMGGSMPTGGMGGMTPPGGDTGGGFRPN